MGLDNFDIAPDNKGGRKGKSSSTDEEDDNGRDTHGRPYHPGVEDPEDWWQETAEEALSQTSRVPNYNGEFSDDPEVRDSQVRVVASYAHINSIDAREKMEECEFMEVDWERVADTFDNPPLSLIRDSPSVDPTPTKEQSASSNPSGGLQSIVDNAK